MQLHERTIAELTTFVETLTDGQSQPVQWFVWEMLFGMIAGGSVLLSEIGRQLEQDTALLSIEKRLSRQVGSDRWAEQELQEGYLELVSPRVKADTVLALDSGDLTKAYAQAMEGLCQVWDGSEGTVGTGEWLVQGEAHQPTGQRFPRWLQAWSQETPEFVSENRELLEVIPTVREATGWQGIWGIDRGGDRLVTVADGPGGQRQKSLREVAAKVKLPGCLAIRHRDRRGRWHTVVLSYGHRGFTWQGAPYGLVVVQGTDPPGLSAALECGRCRPGAQTGVPPGSPPGRQMAGGVAAGGAGQFGVWLCLSNGVAATPAPPPTPGLRAVLPAAPQGHRVPSPQRSGNALGRRSGLPAVSFWVTLSLVFSLATPGFFRYPGVGGWQDALFCAGVPRSGPAARTAPGVAGRASPPAAD